jgi:hypothetical protein
MILNFTNNLPRLRNLDNSSVKVSVYKHAIIFYEVTKIFHPFLFFISVLALIKRMWYESSDTTPFRLISVVLGLVTQHYILPTPPYIHVDRE